MASLRPIVVDAVKRHSATVIILHGLGDNGYGWLPVPEQWHNQGRLQDVSFILPNAPNIPITVNGGMAMPGWYDIVNFDSLNRSEDEPGVMRTREYVHGLISDQIKAGIPAKRIILGGFSQGGACSLFSGLTFPERLAGVFGLSCYQLLPDKFDALRNELGRSKGEADNVFMGHGADDPLVRHEWGAVTANSLRTKNVNVEFKAYEGIPHSASSDEIDDLEKWIADTLKESGEGAAGSSSNV